MTLFWKMPEKNNKHKKNALSNSYKWVRHWHHFPEIFACQKAKNYEEKKILYYVSSWKCIIIVKMYMIIPESTVQNFFSIWLIRFMWMNKIKYYSFFCYVGLSWMPSFSCQDSTQYSWNVMDETSKYASFVPLSVPSNSPNYCHDWPLLSIMYGSSNPRFIKTWFCGEDDVT